MVQNSHLNITVIVMFNYTYDITTYLVKANV